jgi:hypothetical protein
VAHQADCFSKSGRKSMKDLHCWTEAVYQHPIPTAIFFKSLLPFLQKLKDVIGSSGELQFFGEGILREVYTRGLSKVSQGIDD